MLVLVLVRPPSTELVALIAVGAVFDNDTVQIM